MKLIAAIVLAAGKGERVGRPKIDLDLGGVPFWRLIVTRLRKAGIRDIALVVRRSQKALVGGQRLARTVVNHRPGLGMFSSIQRGLRAMEGYSGYMLCPVDHPDVEVRTYRKLRDGFARSSDAVVRPVYNAKPGHPIVIPRQLADQLCKAHPTGRLDHGLRGTDLKIKNIHVTDKSVLININTHEELKFAREHHRGHTRRRSR